MKTEIHIDPNCGEPKLILLTPALTEEQQALLSRLEQQTALMGYRGDIAVRLMPEDIYRIYTEGQQITAETRSGNFTLRQRLYELEQRLQDQDFIRISQGEIINLGLTQEFDLQFSGTIRVKMQNGAETYVSRRYVKKIKQSLGI